MKTDIIAKLLEEELYDEDWYHLEDEDLKLLRDEINEINEDRL